MHGLLKEWINHKFLVRLTF